MEETIVEIDNGDVLCYQLDLDNAPLILLKARIGYVMCGYLNMDTANKLGDIAGKVTGVNNINDALNASVVEISNEAKKKKLRIGMKAKDFLNELIKC